MNLKKRLLFIIPIIFGFFLVWYSISKLEPEDVDSIKNAFSEVNYFWIFISLFLGFLSHLSRAYRWNFLLEPLDYKIRFLNSVFSVFITYLLNLVFPRSGELARASVIQKYEKIPFEKGFSTIVTERIIDVIILFGIALLAFYFQSELIKGIVFGDVNSWYLKGGILLLVLAFVYISFRLAKKSNHPFIKKILKVALGFVQGLKAVFKMKKKAAFIFHSLFIWMMYVLMFYTASLSIPGTAMLPFEASVVGFVAGAFSLSVTNGGLGVFPLLVAGALGLYGVDYTIALAFGWIMWTVQTAMLILFGSLSFLLLPFYNKNREIKEPKKVN